MESGRKIFIMGYDPLGWGGSFMESGRGNFIMGHERGCLWGSPNIGRREGARGGGKGREGGERGARGDGDGRQGESQRVRGNNMLRPFRVGADTHGIRKKRFYHGIQSFTMGGEIHGIREKKFYHGIRPFRVRGGHSWNQEEETLSWDTRGGGFGGPPHIGRREGWQGARGGREGMEMGDKARARVRGNFNMLRPFRVVRGNSWN